MEKKMWFRAKRYGWGWYPVTWQGWAIIAMFVFVMISNVVYISNHEFSDSDFLAQFIPQTFILVVFLIIICYETGEKTYWRWGTKTEEMVDVLNEQGEQTGAIAPKSTLHEKGLWHASAAVWIFNSKNEVLLQFRGPEKKNEPNMWDTSAAGHTASGERVLQTALREMKEELGLSADKKELQYIGTAIHRDVLNNGTYFDNEFGAVYVLKKDFDIGALTLQKSEVEKVAWMPFEEFKKKVIAKDESICDRTAEHKILFDYFDK